jgi:hypothetical protein
MTRVAVLAACTLTCVAGLGLAEAAPCTPGDEACPVVLKMKPGATTITATGSVSGERPNYYFKFAARAGQKITIHTEGGGLKTGPGIPISGPNGFQDAVDEDTAFSLPATGAYVINLHANTMSDGPFGRFEMNLTIK